MWYRVVLKIVYSYENNLKSKLLDSSTNISIFLQKKKKTLKSVLGFEKLKTTITPMTQLALA